MKRKQSLNPHNWLRKVYHKKDYIVWRCNYCGVVDTIDSLNKCEYCGETPICSPTCPGIMQILNNPLEAYNGET